MFIDAQSEISTAIKDCFPLHPVSTFILPRLSERVAQNERTLFTFLSAEGTATLASFLDSYKNGFTLVTPDQIYDYFEPLLKKEVYEGEIHNTFILTSTILNQLPEGTLGSKIIKTISLIYILEQFERLSPTKEQIIGIYSGVYEVSEIEKAISELIEKEFVVYIKRSNDYLRLKRTSGVNIQQKIHDLMDGVLLIRAGPEQQVHLQRLHKIRFQPCALIRFVLRVGRERIRFTPLGFIPLSLISS